MTTLFNLGSVGEGLPHAENTGLVISDTANIRTISFPASVFQIFSMKMLRNQKIVVSLQIVGRGQRNEKQMDYQDVRTCYTCCHLDGGKEYLTKLHSMWVDWWRF